MRSGAFVSIILHLRHPSAQEALSKYHSKRMFSQRVFIHRRETYSGRLSHVFFRLSPRAGSLTAKGHTAPRQSLNPTQGHVLVSMLDLQFPGLNPHSCPGYTLKSCLLHFRPVPTFTPVLEHSARVLLTPAHSMYPVCRVLSINLTLFPAESGCPALGPRHPRIPLIFPRLS